MVGRLVRGVRVPICVELVEDTRERRVRDLVHGVDQRPWFSLLDPDQCLGDPGVERLRRFPNFRFVRMDLTDRTAMEELFRVERFPRGPVRFDSPQGRLSARVQ